MIKHALFGLLYLLIMSFIGVWGVYYQSYCLIVLSAMCGCASIRELYRLDSLPIK